MVSHLAGEDEARLYKPTTSALSSNPAKSTTRNFIFSIHSTVTSNRISAMSSITYGKQKRNANSPKKLGEKRAVDGEAISSTKTLRTLVSSSSNIAWRRANH
jgi:hypothetical protein